MKKMKNVLSLILAVIAIFTMSSLSTGLMDENKDNGAIIDDDGNVVGYAFGGLYWDAEEYEEMIGTTTTRSFADTLTVVQSNEVASISSNELTANDETLLEEVTHPLGMAIATVADEDGNFTTFLGGYKFIEEKGVSLGKLMNRLEAWALVRSPYADLFFSQNVVYKAVKIADEEPASVSVEVDEENNQTIVFGLHEDISEISEWDLLSALRFAVVNSNIELDIK